jgi:hypothetical protein
MVTDPIVTHLGTWKAPVLLREELTDNSHKKYHDEKGDRLHDSQYHDKITKTLPGFR